METLKEAYKLAKKNNGAPGIDGVTFKEIEEKGLEPFLQGIHEQLTAGTYLPLKNRKQEIPKPGGKVRILGIPAIRDRVVQGSLKLILEAIFEADFQSGSYGYRPKKNPQEAIERVSVAIIQGKTKVIDLDLKSYFDNVRHDILLGKIAQRVQDDKVMHLLKLILKASGKKGVPQGGVISPLLSNIYLNEVDKMLEKARAVTTDGQYTRIDYARFADDLVVLVDGHERHEWILNRICRRLKEELAKIGVEVNKEKTRIVDMKKGGKFGFLGFDFKRYKTSNGKWGVMRKPKMKARTALLRRIKEVFQRHKSQPINEVVRLINPMLRGWVNYFRTGNSSRTFDYIKDWVKKKIRRHLMRARNLQGFGWNWWSSARIHGELKLFNDYRIIYPPGLKAKPTQ
jgi:RNA-directed DNA polymerase